MSDVTAYATNDYPDWVIRLDIGSGNDGGTSIVVGGMIVPKVRLQVAKEPDEARITND